MPNFHLTQACFRDLKKHVVKNSGWDLKRVEALRNKRSKTKSRRKARLTL